MEAAEAVVDPVTAGALFTFLDRLAFWWLRRRFGSVTVMETPAMQWALANYHEFAGTERS